MRAGLAALTLLIILSAANPAAAIRRGRIDHPFFARTAVSGYIGGGIAVGEFSNEILGNHESGAFDWSAEIEHFFAPGVSLGFNITHTSYDDKEYGSVLKTNLSAFGGFLRYVVDTPGPAYPFLRFGVGSMEVEFEDKLDPEFPEIVESERAVSLSVGGGGVFMVGDYVSLNASVLYTFGFTDEAVVEGIVEVDGEEFIPVVGFDVQYWTFAGGVSVYFP
jgi:hypothetical protein